MEAGFLYFCYDTYVIDLAILENNFAGGKRAQPRLIFNFGSPPGTIQC